MDELAPSQPGATTDPGRAPTILRLPVLPVPFDSTTTILLASTSDPTELLEVITPINLDEE